jgi:hypothetical protein
VIHAHVPFGQYPLRQSWLSLHVCPPPYAHFAVSRLHPIPGQQSGPRSQWDCTIIEQPHVRATLWQMPVQQSVSVPHG